MQRSLFLLFFVIALTPSAPSAQELEEDPVEEAEGSEYRLLVLDASGRKESRRHAIRVLRENDFVVTAARSARKAKPRAEVRYSTGFRGLGKDIADALGIEIVLPSNKLKDYSIAVILGEDWAETIEEENEVGSSVARSNSRDVGSRQASMPSKAILVALNAIPFSRYGVKADEFDDAENETGFDLGFDGRFEGKSAGFQFRFLSLEVDGQDAGSELNFNPYFKVSAGQGREGPEFFFRGFGGLLVLIDDDGGDDETEVGFDLGAAVGMKWGISEQLGLLGELGYQLGVVFPDGVDYFTAHHLGMTVGLGYLFR